MEEANRHLWKFKVADASASPDVLGHWQITTYKGSKKAPGQYNWHADVSPVDTEDADQVARMLSATVQLSSPEDYVGGALQFPTHDGGKALGSMSLFPAFYPHRVTPTTSGSRYSIVAWFPAKQGGRPPRSWFKSLRWHYKRLQNLSETGSDRLLHELVSC